MKLINLLENILGIEENARKHIDTNNFVTPFHVELGWIGVGL